MNLLEGFLLILVRTLDLLCQFVFLVEGGVFVFDNVHLQNSA